MSLIVLRRIWRLHPPHRLLPDPGAHQEWLSVECFGGLHLPHQWRNEAGQLRMDAPYSHRDFRRPEFRGPEDDGVRELVVKKGGARCPCGASTPWLFGRIKARGAAGSRTAPRDARKTLFRGARENRLDSRQ